MLRFIIILIICSLNLPSFSQDWYRNDFHFKITDSIDGELKELNPEILKENNYKMYALTSSYSGIRKFYFDEDLNHFRLVSEIMDGTKDPYLIITKADSLMGILLLPSSLNENSHKILDFKILDYKSGLFKIDSWVETGRNTPIYFKDDKNLREMSAAVMESPEITIDKSMTLKQIDKNYSYAYPFMGTKQTRPEGTKVYELDIF